MAQVALKMHKVVQDPRDVLRTEAEMHVSAWVKLGHVINPIGYLEAHDKTGTPAILVLEVAMYVHSNLPVGYLNARDRTSTTMILVLEVGMCAHRNIPAVNQAALYGANNGAPVKKKW